MNTSNIIAVLNNANTIIEKQGDLGTDWTTVAGLTGLGQINLFRMGGGMIGAVTGSDSELYVIQSYTGGPVWSALETNNVKDFALTSNSIVVLQNNNNVMVKVNGLGTGWESNPLQNVASIASDGDRVAALTSTGNLYVRDFTTGLGWVLESTNVKQFILLGSD